MNQKDNNNLKFKKSVDNNSNNDSQFQKEVIKARIMDKYGVSSSEAEKILFYIMKKEEEKHKKQNNTQKSQQHDSVSLKQNYKRKKHSNTKASRSITGDIPRTYNHISIDTHEKNDEGVKVLKDKQGTNNHNIKLSNNSLYSQKIKEKQKEPILNNNDESMSANSNVDSILGDIIPNYNQQISIKVDHVDLTFEVSNEKVDTLKETFIRTIKRNRSKKIKIHALKDVSFQVYKGEKVGIIGYNGAGKSTLLNVITGIYPPDSGSVTTQGKISPLLSLGAGFDINFSGRRNIYINGAVLGYDKKFLESKIDEIIEFSELGEFIDIPLKNYSSGMLAKLAFSIATIVDPDILIIDEILGVGDINFAKKSSDKIKSLMDGGTTVLLVSHSIPQIREICDKAIWIDKGSVRAIGEVNKVCDEYLKDAEKASNEQLANIQLVNK